ncbi:methyltransferase, TIGR04325 family [Candidatus Berkiella cookevillensis]|uniref:Methyltransferase domain protein n=1 Tax=Candidatus Berkiella cookevillensis TaxID=437022 RepID=A0A0Q9YGK6_9GAMM|nr:methyltransferase, TIGR04325 family [Candidatus Berkiella cookevillensis]MCS5707704.1 methyltransferase, TIGR04325 family [Candidatus Berkiella cookevillensis]
MYLIKDYLPPVLTRSLRALKNHRKIYSSFAQAKAACNSEGFEGQALVDMVFFKTQQYREVLKQKTISSLSIPESFLVATIAKMNQSHIRVLDLGGAFGAHYFFIRNFFPHISFDWVIIETSAIAKRGSELNDKNLSFIAFENIDKTQLGSFDLVLTSATLQHVPDPTETLEFLLSLNAPWLVFLRSSFCLDAEHFWVIHKSLYSDSGPGPKPEGMKDGLSEFPFALVSKQIFEKKMQVRYKEIFCISDNSGLLEILGKECIGFNRLYQLQNSSI